MNYKKYVVECRDCGHPYNRFNTWNFTCAACKRGEDGWWYGIRKKMIEDHPFCSICDTKEHLHVHHLDGNHKNNYLKNLEVRCWQCHPSLHHHSVEEIIEIERGLIGNRLIYQENNF